MRLRAPGMHLPLPDTAIICQQQSPRGQGYPHRAHPQQAFLRKRDVTEVPAQRTYESYMTCSLLLLCASKSTGLLQRGDIK